MILLGNHGAHTARCSASRAVGAAVRLCLVVLLSLVSGCSLSGYGASRAQVRTAVYHEVKRGESLWSIGKRYGVSSTTLMRLNGLRNADGLSAGRRILVGYRYTDAGEETEAMRTQPVSSRSSGHVFISRGRLAWPVNTGYIASTFGPRNEGFHDGLDFAAPRGSPVFAAHNGRIAYADNDLSGYGNLVILRGDEGLITVYAHNDTFLVSEGDRVVRGERIAKVGSTGRSSGPHLHFEVRARDSRGRYVAVDPYPLLTEKDLKTKPRYRVNENLFGLMAKMFK